jgi:hypothetical protein
MSRGFYIGIPRKEQVDLPADPRFPIADHIGWTRPTLKLETDWSTPEPDNYNRAIMASKPILCPFLKDSVFYRDNVRSAWWSVYLVPPDQIEVFNEWFDQQEHIIRWHQPHPAAIRCRKGFLYNRKNGSDITAEERLFCMGYYAKLSSKFFADDDAPLLKRMGTVRADLLDIINAMPRDYDYQ